MWENAGIEGTAHATHTTHATHTAGYMCVCVYVCHLSLSLSLLAYRMASSTLRHLIAISTADVSSAASSRGMVLVALSAIMPSRAIIAVTVRKLSIGVPAKRNEEGRMYKPILVLIAYL